MQVHWEYCGGYAVCTWVRMQWKRTGTCPLNPTTILNQEAAKLCLSATPFLPAIVKRHLVQHTEIIEMHTSFTLHAGCFAGYMQGISQGTYRVFRRVRTGYAQGKM